VDSRDQDGLKEMRWDESPPKRGQLDKRQTGASLPVAGEGEVRAPILQIFRQMLILIDWRETGERAAAKEMMVMAVGAAKVPCRVGWPRDLIGGPGSLVRAGETPAIYGRKYLFYGSPALGRHPTRVLADSLSLSDRSCRPREGRKKERRKRRMCCAAAPTIQTTYYVCMETCHPSANCASR
jgi:hypothetical protein